MARHYCECGTRRHMCGYAPFVQESTGVMTASGDHFAKLVHQQQAISDHSPGTWPAKALTMLAQWSAVLICLTAWSLSPAAETPSAEIPFELHGGLLWVQVEVPQSAGPLKFLVDSGASASVINLCTAKRLGLKLAQRVEVRGVGSTSGGFWPQRLLATANDVDLPKDYLAVDLAELSRACECGVDGLLGADFFRGRVVQLDFGERRLRLLGSSEVTGTASVLQAKVSRGMILAAVGIDGGKPQWMRVDTGCASALQRVVNNGKGTVTKPNASVGLVPLDIPSTTTTVKLGEFVFHSVPTGLHRQPIFPGESGLLGSGLLTRFERVTIDPKAGRLVLEGRRTDS
jgi:aspartyl protease